MANFLVDHEYTLDITPSARPQLVHVSEYDVGRRFTFTIMQGGEEFIGLTSSVGDVTVEGTIGSYAFSEPASIENGKIVFQLTESMTAHAGKAWTKIKFANADAPISTCAFFLVVDRAGVEAETVIGADGFDEKIRGAVDESVAEYLNDFAIDDEVVRDAVDDYLDENGIDTESITTATTDWLNDNVTPVGSAVVVDSSLSIEGAAADAKVTGDKFDDLKSAIENEYVPIVLVSNGSFSASGTYTTNNKRIRTNFFQVKIGDKIAIRNGTLKHAVGAWYETLNSSNIIRNDSTFSADDETIISEINGYYIVVFAKSDISQTIALSDYDGSIEFYANQIYRNTVAIENIKNNAVTQEMMELCEIEQVEASANIWDPSTVISGGGVQKSGQNYASADYCHQRIGVTSGETLYFYKIGATATVRWLCAYDSNGNPVSASGSDTAILSYTVPSGIVEVSLSVDNSINSQFMVFVNNSTTPTTYISYVSEHERYVATKEFLKNINMGVTIVDVPVYETNETLVTTTTGAVIANGTIRTDYDTYEYSQKISVSAGDVVKPIGDEGIYFRFVCAYNGNNVVSSSGKSEGVTKYVVPVGIDGVVVTTLISNHITSVSVTHQTGTEEHTYPICQKLGKFNWEGNLTDGDSVELLASNVRYDVVWAFTGHVTNMGKIVIGIKSASGTIKTLCAVDSTYIYYRKNDGTLGTEAHGLTISEDLQIRIDSPMIVNELGAITIYSDGTKYTLSATAYGTDMTGTPYLASDGASMTDCAFSWIPQNIDKPIWVFGDSWVSMYDTRWPYYMEEAGYVNNWMLNGFAGEDTDEAYEALLNLLTIRKPEYIVWLLGMNNGDSAGAVNAVWKEIYDALIALCTDYKITPILYTVPNTPTIDNSYKNAIVTASGYRYIDGVAAVGDDGSGNWFTGYEQSASDHNHTSGKGARALFMRILTDFPEIAGNGI